MPLYRYFNRLIEYNAPQAPKCIRCMTIFLLRNEWLSEDNGHEVIGHERPSTERAFFWKVFDLLLGK